MKNLYNNIIEIIEKEWFTKDLFVSVVFLLLKEKLPNKHSSMQEKFANDFINKYYPIFLQRFADKISQELGEKDLEKILLFYNTPCMQKYLYELDDTLGGLIVKKFEYQISLEVTKRLSSMQEEVV